MSTEHLLREFYNEMYRVHMQPDNGYDIGDHLYHLAVHKHLDQDPLIQFPEAFRWVDQSRARLVADAGCGYGGFAVFVARQAPDSRNRWLYAERCATSCCPMTASSGGMMRLSPLNRSATPLTWRQRFAIGPGSYGPRA
jgi:SAM-dependent methyltransferase